MVSCEVFVIQNYLPSLVQKSASYIIYPWFLEWQFIKLHFSAVRNFNGLLSLWNTGKCCTVTGILRTSRSFKFLKPEERLCFSEVTMAEFSASGRSSFSEYREVIRNFACSCFVQVLLCRENRPVRTRLHWQVQSLFLHGLKRSTYVWGPIAIWSEETDKNARRKRTPGNNIPQVEKKKPEESSDHFKLKDLPLSQGTRSRSWNRTGLLAMISLAFHSCDFRISLTHNYWINRYHLMFTHHMPLMHRHGVLGKKKNRSFFRTKWWKLKGKVGDIDSLLLSVTKQSCHLHECLSMRDVPAIGTHNSRLKLHNLSVFRQTAEVFWTEVINFVIGSFLLRWREWWAWYKGKERP